MFTLQPLMKTKGSNKRKIRRKTTLYLLLTPPNPQLTLALHHQIVLKFQTRNGKTSGNSDVISGHKAAVLISTVTDNVFLFPILERKKKQINLIMSKKSDLKK